MTIKGLDQWLTTPPEDYYIDDHCYYCGKELPEANDEFVYDGFCSLECERHQNRKDAKKAVIDHNVPRDWYFTWGFNQGHDNCYTVIHGTFNEARAKMCKRWGEKWGFQYPTAEAAGVERFRLKEVI